MRIFIHLLRGRGQGFIHASNGPRNRSVQIGHGFYRLDRTEGLACRNLRAHLGQFDEHDVAERILGVVRDADGTVGGDPLMFFCIFPVGRIWHVVLAPGFSLLAIRFSLFFSDAYKMAWVLLALLRPVRGFRLLPSFQPQPARAECRRARYSFSRTAPESRW